MSDERIESVFKDLLALAAVPAPGIVAPTFGPPTLRDEIADFSPSLPSDYKQYLLLCRSIQAGDYCPSVALLSPLCAALLARDDSVPVRMHLATTSGLEEIPLLPFATDGGERVYLLTHSHVPGTVWVWRNDYPVRFDRTATEGMQPVAPTFTDFLIQLLASWTQYSTDARRGG